MTHHYEPVSETTPSQPLPSVATEAVSPSPNSLTADETEALFTTIQNEARRQNKGRLFRLTIGRTLAVVWIIQGFVQLAFHWHTPFQFFLSLLIFCTMMFNWYFNSKTPMKAISQLALLQDKRTSGLLCDLLVFEETDIKQMARTALTELLPKLQASDASLLNAAQRRNLYESLSIKNHSFTLAALKAMEQIGDGAAVPYVEKLIKPLEKEKYDSDILNAARACLPFLQERAEQEKASQSLLRASESATAPDVLLRPVAGQAEAAPEQLLRASNDTGKKNTAGE